MRSDEKRERELQELLAKGKDDTGESAKYTEELTKVYEQLEAIDAHTAESRAAIILTGLSFTPEMQTVRLLNCMQDCNDVVLSAASHEDVFGWLANAYCTGKSFVLSA